ncbi:DUF2171 domain-containing protein [Sphingomonas psychrotolerans]|uniref:DUF2171 domain-containing protein n=1 Tax=Sphingomonas psychrotolerans TaxID=1327635 RepID=A0ABU3N2U7_9SPHN|nr:DUF2171 domain-containing protein [Sphingomonas psychrotolerans]MDT8758793.1 DUF2171 domain-containing protein [Sphingomonas psychrotolerans]
MDDRNRRYGQRDYYGRSSSQDYSQDYGSGRDYTYSSARDYAAAGELGRNRSDYGARGWRNEDDLDDRDRGYRSQRGGWDEARSDYYRGGVSSQRHFDAPVRGYDRDRSPERSRARYDDDRGFLERAGDEIRSWFGDEEAERRRERDQRYDAASGYGERARGGSGDPHYHAWRRQRIAELDRDYDEYQRENSERFHNEFTNWRTERQGQRDSLRRVSEHMEVLGSDGSHVGKVDKVRGDRILLTRSDGDSGGHHHSIPSRWIQSVDDKVILRKTAEEAKAHWRDEESSGALFGDRTPDRDEDRQDWSSERNLNRSFSGTY